MLSDNLAEDAMACTSSWVKRPDPESGKGLGGVSHRFGIIAALRIVHAT